MKGTSTIIVLGCGLMGPTIARDCAESSEVSEVVIGDIDEKKLEKAEKNIANPKLKTTKLSVTGHEGLVECLKGFDVVVNATAPRFALGVLEEAMEAGVTVVDLSGGGYPMEGEIYGRVEAAGITAIPGCEATRASSISSPGTGWISWTRWRGLLRLRRPPEGPLAPPGL